MKGVPWDALIDGRVATIVNAESQEEAIVLASAALNVPARRITVVRRTADVRHTAEENIKALEQPGRWEVRALSDGTRRLILWTQEDKSASWMTMSEEDCRALAAALLKGLQNEPGVRCSFYDFLKPPRGR